MRKILSLAFVSAVAAGLFACGGDSSSSGPDGKDEVVESSNSTSVPFSSSSDDSELSGNSSSSSGETASPDSSNESSGSTTDSSDSSTGSSSSEEQNSSSDGGSSSSLVIPDGWSWDVPKETRLNPKINYGTMNDTRDQKPYKTITIGEGENARTWMAENLNYYKDTDLSVKDKSWCYGCSTNENSANCDVAGRLYTWAAAIDSAKLYKDKLIDCGYGKTCALPDTVYGICPPGWHLPSKTEWEALITAVGGKSTAGKVLKSQTGWEYNGNGTDALGFSALPAGSRVGNLHFYSDGCNAYFWSASEDDGDFAYIMYLRYNYEEALLLKNNKYVALSVRCVENQK